MTKITNAKGMELYSDISKSGMLKSTTQITKTVKTDIFVLDGWEYSFLFYNGKLSKIEGSNHRELIENWVE